MIGLGSNRLSVCRRGGMRVTQAGRGGMEWLLGGRGALGATPYSAQATAALNAQFPTQWATIRDYGFAHPEIVGYMNAYAPEDAKIAYSLVEGIGTRYLVSPNSGAYADTDLYGDQDTRVIFTGILLEDNIGDTIHTFGADASYNSRNFSAWLRYLQWNSDSIGYAGAQIYGSGVGLTPKDTKFTIDANQNHWVNKLEDGTVVWDKTFTQRTFTTPGTMVINGFKRNSTVYSGGVKGCTEMEIYQRDIHKRFIPLKKDGNFEFLDLVSGNLATRVGTFTELIESPS